MKMILASLNSKYIHSNLAIRYLKGYSGEEDIELFEGTINEYPFDIAFKIAGKKPGIVGFSCYIWNIENTLKVCSILKEIDENIKIILGGPEVSFDSKDILKRYEYVDYVISGEGETAFKELINSIRKDIDPQNINGLAYRKGEEIFKGPEQQIIEDLNMLPFPYSEGIPDKIIYYEASRGCPFSCSYCLSSTIRGVRYLNADRVKRELKFFIDNDVSLVKFVDRTFNANKKFAMDIWSYLIENGGNTRFHFEIAADLLDVDTIKLLSSAPAGLFQFEIGVQTTNTSILENIDRVMDFEEVKANVVKIMEKGNIPCHLDLIAGLPGENLTSFRKSFDDCMSISPDVLQLGFLKVLKGSPVESNAAEYGIHYMKYPPYQVLKTNDLSFNDMQSLLRVEDIFETYYNSGNFKYSIGYILKNAESKFDFFMEFSQYLYREGYFDRNFDLKDKFKFLYDYSVYKYNDDDSRDVLLHDYVLTTKKSFLPDFLKREISEEVKNKVKDEIRKEHSEPEIRDAKKLAYFPVDICISMQGRDHIYENCSAIVIIDLQNQRFSYIK